MKYTITKGQLITLWVFGSIIWLWSVGELLDYGSDFALPIFFIVPAGLIYYTIGWRKNNKKQAPTRHEEQVAIHEEEKEHDHNACEATNRKYVKHGIIWLAAPTILLILTLVAYSIASFVTS